MRLKLKSLPRRDSGCQIPQWKRELASAFRRPGDLLEALELGHAMLPGARAAAAKFRFLVPVGYASLMEKKNPKDPLLRQVLPSAEELAQHPGYVPDPVGDLNASMSPGLLQKYDGRALLLASGACAVQCRYCFRRHFPYAEGGASSERKFAALEKLAASHDINEVILSGGDPLMLDDHAFAALVGELQSIPHLARLRIHTRMPIVLPSRITSALCETLRTSRLPPVVVVHANHPRELSDEVQAALSALRRAGITLLNQSVLLRGVNDSVRVLEELSEALFASGVLPYYLHLLDRVTGAAHFEVDLPRATSLVATLRSRLPGYLVPRLAREDPGCPSKTILL